MDGTFVRFYPTLLEVAERKGTLRADFKPFTASPVRLYHTLARDGWPAAEKVLAAAQAEDAGAAVVNPAVLNSVGYELLGAKKALELLPGDASLSERQRQGIEQASRRRLAERTRPD